jgi:hypothetical protein
VPAGRLSRSGYEREVLALDRILVELQAHRLEILADDSGKEALAWLARERTHDISKRVRKHAPDDLYANLSEDAHGDPGPVAHLHDPESGMIDLAPRRGLSTRASLIELYAGLARDQAVLIADLAGIELQGVEQLDQQIVAAQKELARDYEAAEGKQ